MRAPHLYFPLPPPAESALKPCRPRLKRHGLGWYHEAKALPPTVSPSAPSHARVRPRSVELYLSNLSLFMSEAMDMDADMLEGPSHKLSEKKLEKELNAIARTDARALRRAGTRSHGLSGLLEASESVGAPHTSANTNLTRSYADWMKSGAKHVVVPQAAGESRGRDRVCMSRAPSCRGCHISPSNLFSSHQISSRSILY